LNEEFESDDNVDVPNGNKTVTLQPPAQIDYETIVTENSGGILRASSVQQLLALDGLSVMRSWINIHSG
jgi:hypothetical protein